MHQVSAAFYKLYPSKEMLLLMIPKDMHSEISEESAGIYSYKISGNSWQ